VGFEDVAADVDSAGAPARTRGLASGLRDPLAEYNMSAPVTTTSRAGPMADAFNRGIRCRDDAMTARGSKRAASGVPLWTLAQSSTRGFTRGSPTSVQVEGSERGARRAVRQSLFSRRTTDSRSVRAAIIRRRAGDARRRAGVTLLSQDGASVRFESSESWSSAFRSSADSISWSSTSTSSADSISWGASRYAPVDRLSSGASGSSSSSGS